MKFFEYLFLLIKYKDDPFYIKYLKDKKVLDVGCGLGKFLEKNPKSYVGIDINYKLISIAKKRGLKVYKQSALNLKLKNDSFDVIHASQIIEHFSSEDAALFLTNVSRVLKSNGIVYIKTPGVRNVWNTFSHIRPYPPQSFKKLLTSDTESYLNFNSIPLIFEGAWGTSFFSRNKLINLLFKLLDLIFKPSNPIGWLIILRKK